MIHIVINKKKVEVSPDLTVLQACESIGIEIPRFCYHDRLSIAGNCRMCLVEQIPAPGQKIAKPLIASCAFPVSPNLQIDTSSPLVKKAREGVLEFLLVNHPLDCPVCDQGGECDLQDQSMVFGNDRGRFYDSKRAVEDKDCGPLIKTVMNRCIHCTRCVRFATEIAGIHDLGVLGRGSKMEIGTYVKNTVKSELSGNIIDVCPVGALTSKPYAFVARPWELKTTPSIDTFDALGSNIRIDTRGNEIMRILPRLNENINEEWISDKVRFSYDAYKNQRLDTPMIRRNGNLVSASWNEAFQVILEALQRKKDGVHTINDFETINHLGNSHKFTPITSIQGFVGPHIDAEALVVFKDLLNLLGASSLTDVTSISNIDPSLRANYLFNTDIVGLDQADLCVLINTNPRVEAPVLNARIRQNVINNNLNVINLGPINDLTYPVRNLGDNPKTLVELIEGKHWICQQLYKARKPMIIIGEAFFSRPDGHNLRQLIDVLVKFTKIRDLASNWNGLNILPLTASVTAQNELNFTNRVNFKNLPKYHADIIYSLGYDSEDLVRDGKRFIIYQGHHGDLVAHQADVILPGLTPVEKNGIFLNMAGISQKTRFVLTPPGNARNDWKILKALHLYLKEHNFITDNDVHMNYLSLSQIRDRLYSFSSNFIISTVSKNTSGIINTFTLPTNHLVGTVSNITKYYDESITLNNQIKNFYMTDSISRASKVMAECSKTLLSTKSSSI